MCQQHLLGCNYERSYQKQFIFSILAKNNAIHILFIIRQCFQMMLSQASVYIWEYFLCFKTPMEKEMATHSSTLAWKIPWTEKLLRAWQATVSPWCCKEQDTTKRLHFTFTLLYNAIIIFKMLANRIDPLFQIIMTYNLK